MKNKSRLGARLRLGILALMLISFMGKRADAQTTTLPQTGTQTITSLTSNDYVIPEGFGFLTLELRGGDGGDVRLNGSLCQDIKGGEGATMYVSYQVGPSSDQLKPGGLLRVFVGQAGGIDEHACIDQGNFAGGGGGSSAVLYQAPGQATWNVLSIAGAGGGANRPLAGTRLKGKGGNAIDQGDDVFESFVDKVSGGLLMGFDFSNGESGRCAESSFGVYGSGYAGGGVNCISLDDRVGKSMLEKNGYTTSFTLSAAGYIITSLNGSCRPISYAANTGGTYNTADGGDGFTGGGIGDGGGGGGGGSSGGAATGGQAGGGGGSWISAQFPPSNIVRTGGGDGGGNNNNGYVKLTTQLNNNYPDARCKANPILPIDAYGNTVLRLNMVNDGSIVPLGGEILLSIQGGPSIALPRTLTNSCPSVGTKLPLVLTVKDETGQFTDQCSAEMLIKDEIPPTILTRDITLQLDENGNAFLTPSQIDDGSSDNCGGMLSTSLDKTNFNCTDIGVNEVIYTVTDQHNNSASKHIIVTVEGQNELQALCKSMVIAELDKMGWATILATDLDNGSTDNCGDLNFTFTDGSTMLDFDCSQAGTTSFVELVVSNASGSKSTCMSQIAVQDNIAPVAKCKDVTIELDKDGKAEFLESMINDGSSDNCAYLVWELNSVILTCDNIGSFEATFTAKDRAGNSTSCEGTVTVVDHIAPVVITKDITVHLDAVGTATITAADIDDGSSDACGIGSMSLSKTSFSSSDVGQHTVILTVIDVNDNVSTKEATVTVEAS